MSGPVDAPARTTRITRVERLAAAAPAGEGRVRPLVWALEVDVEAVVDPATGMVMNLADLKAIVRREVVEPLEGRLLDGRDGRPAVSVPEDLLREVRRRLADRFGRARLAGVRLVDRPFVILETGSREDAPMEITRIYEFSASHRLHATGLSDEENRRVFGKCNRPHGHGHNYVLEVTVLGSPEPGREILPAADFDRIVNERVVEAWDHRHLNVDVPEFAAVNPTAEEIARVAFERLAGPIAAAGAADVRLARVRLRETDRNHAEYPGREATS